MMVKTNTKFQTADPSRVSEISKKYHVGKLASELLAGSGLNDAQIAEMCTGDDRIADSNADCIVAARDRIMKAKANHEKVFVGGDYDADGMTSTAIMKYTLDALGIENGYYIPNRDKDGYGLQPGIVELAVRKGYTLFITVDNGVSAQEAISAVHAHGLDIIVTDHQDITAPVGADILVHPTVLEPSRYSLSGAGVALLLSRALIGQRDNIDLLAGVAAVTDLMPMWGDARRLVKRAIHTGPGAVPVIADLCGGAKAFNEETIGFQVGPRLNSVGRLNDPAMSVNAVPKALLSTDPAQASVCAGIMTDLNNVRKDMTAHLAESAEKFVTPDMGIIAIYDPDIPKGVCGIVAGQITEKYHKPSIVLSGKNEITGSARSTSNFNIKEYLDGWEHFTRFGGHPMAAGMSMTEADVPAFIDYCRKAVVPAAVDGTSALLVDPDALTVTNIDELDTLRPFPKDMNTLIAIPWPEKADVKQYPKVTKICFPQGLEAVFFPQHSPITIPEHPAYITGRVSINEWNDRRSVQILVEDII